MASSWAKKARSLHGLHVVRSAHFLSLLAEAVGVSWCHTTALFDSLLESLQRRNTTAGTDSGATDVRVGMLLMDYRAQAAATRTLVADVFLTLSKAVAAVWLEAATLVSDVEPEPASPQPELYNLFVNGATASLCSCLKLCQRHAAFLEMTEQAAHPSAFDAHRRASHRWSTQCERLFDLTVDLLADFEEQVYEQLFLP
ncbi:uncharacterized protein LOC119405640 [Rhipicephalus sanguineus]|uniref:Uncharacterized protein n=1 Tax=Rhipicephalus sanguineus TaxID=34632 RepID=A0A9D4PBK3_RHISA|nr:uncharacterized protein LOC119405640 [Rhipicephalus sanguineus]KAH7935232.1 hypothetical protein HPB52_004820 [Rhipicephalus sanguineus]